MYRNRVFARRIFGAIWPSPLVVHEILGTIQIVEAPDVLAAEGQLAVRGTISIAEQPDTLAITGLSGGVIGSLAIVEQADTISLQGTLRVVGGIAIVEPPDTVAVRGTVGVIGTLNVEEQPDTIALGGLVGVIGSIQITEPPDDISVAGLVYDFEAWLTGQRQTHAVTGQPQAPSVASWVLQRTATGSIEDHTIGGSRLVAAIAALHKTPTGTGQRPAAAITGQRYGTTITGQRITH